MHVQMRYSCVNNEPYAEMLTTAPVAIRPYIHTAHSSHSVACSFCTNTRRSQWHISCARQRQAKKHLHSSVESRHYYEFTASCTCLFPSAMTCHKMFVESVPLGSGKLSPQTGCMEDFNEKKQKNEVWFSDPVYSHFGGYKMCLKVLANGFGNCTSTHVTVSGNLMQGDLMTIESGPSKTPSE